MFYVLTKDIKHRTELIINLKENGIHAVFHYISLHSSSYYLEKHDGRKLHNSDNFTDCLVRLPLFYELTEKQVRKIVTLIK